MTYTGSCLIQGGKIVFDTRTLDGEKQKRIQEIKDYCQTVIQAQVPDFKQLKAMQHLQGIAVAGYDDKKAQGILKAANDLRDTSNALEAKINACTDVDQIGFIWWPS